MCVKHNTDTEWTATQRERTEGKRYQCSAEIIQWTNGVRVYYGTIYTIIGDDHLINDLPRDVINSSIDHPLAIVADDLYRVKKPTIIPTRWNIYTVLNGATGGRWIDVGIGLVGQKEEAEFTGAALSAEHHGEGFTPSRQNWVCTEVKNNLVDLDSKRCSWVKGEVTNVERVVRITAKSERIDEIFSFASNKD